MRGTIYTAALAVLISGITGPPAIADPERSPSAASEPPRTVTLITGDKVTVTRRGTTWDAKVVPARRIGAPTGFSRSVDADGVTVIPDEAAPLVAAGKLDKALFDVTGLIELGYDDARTPNIPLLVESGARQRIAALGTVKRDLPAARMTAVSAPKQRAADVFRLAKDQKVWLNGKVYPTLDQSVPQVGGPVAWQAGQTGQGATIAVLDSGYDKDHPDLAGIVKGEKDFTGEGIQDTVGHGTHVTATAAGRGTASGGKYTGVAKGANVLVGKVCQADGCPFDAILDGMQWAADSGAKVVNMSLGGGQGDGTGPLETAVNRISAEKGTLFVIAAGNSGPSRKVASPAAADAALAVASVSKQDKPSRFSSPGPRIKDMAVKPDIAAPGEAIVAARARGTFEDVAVDEFHAKLNGTSMATPHVAGAAAIVAAQHPDWTGQQIKTALMSTAHPVADATIYQQGAGRLDVGRAVTQAVTSTTGSLSMGFIRWPYPTDKITKPVTYKNSGTAPVTLTLELQDAGVFSTDVKQITVPAQGEATVHVTLDPARGGPATYNGRLTAKTDGVEVQTAIGATKEPESYTFTPKLIDRNGVEQQPDGPSTVRWKRLDGLGNGLALSNQPVRLPAGRYAMFGAVQTPTPGRLPLTTMVAEPEFEVREDTTVTLDARPGVKISTQVDEKDARLEAGVTAVNVTGSTPGDDSGYYHTIDDETYAVPTKGNHSQLRYYTRAQMARPLVTLTATKPESFDVPVAPGPQSPAFSGSKELGAVDAGHATPEQIAARDLKGKLAVFTLGAGEENQYDPRIRALADAGAAAVLFYLSEVTGIYANETPPVPVAVTSSAAGSRLAKLGTATVTLTGQPAGPYRYELAYPSFGAIPADLTYRSRNSDLATVKASYHSVVDGGMAYIDYRTWAGDLSMDLELWSTKVALPTERTEYYSPVTWQNTVRIPEGNGSWADHEYLEDKRTYRAGEQRTAEWNKSVIGPAVSVSHETYTAIPHLAYREGDTIRTALPLLSDAARHSNYTWIEETAYPDKGETVLHANGKEVGRSDKPGSGTFTVPAGAADYRLTTTLTRTSPAWPLSTKVSAEWTVKSGHTDRATPLPLLAVGFDPKVDLTNHAKANGVLAIPVRVDRQPGAAGGATTLRTVETSTDDGTTWRSASLVNVNGKWWALVQNPASGFVSLRASASDTDGNTVNQTVIRAYRVK